MTRTDLFRFLPLSILLMSFSVAHAQVTQSGLAPTLPSASAASYYYIAKPGELTMQVNVWGQVRNSGRYEVSSNTDLIQLLSLSGGPLQGADLSDIRIIRFVKKDDSVQVKVEFSVDLENLESVSQDDLRLYPGDTVYVTHTMWVTVRQVLDIVTPFAVLVSIYTQILWWLSR